MVRGRFDRIVRSVASTLAAVFSLALPWARDHGVRVNPIGKAGTLVMMIGLLLAMVTPRGSAATEVVLWSGVILLMIAGALYARAVLRSRTG